MDLQAGLTVDNLLANIISQRFYRLKQEAFMARGLQNLEYLDHLVGLTVELREIAVEAFPEKQEWIMQQFDQVLDAAKWSEQQMLYDVERDITY